MTKNVVLLHSPVKLKKMGLFSATVCKREAHSSSSKKLAPSTRKYIDEPFAWRSWEPRERAEVIKFFKPLNKMRGKHARKKSVYRHNWRIPEPVASGRNATIARRNCQLGGVRTDVLPDLSAAEKDSRVGDRRGLLSSKEINGITESALLMFLWYWAWKNSIVLGEQILPRLVLPMALTRSLISFGYLLVR